MKIIRIALDDPDFVALRDLAHRDRRDPRAQAAVIIERAIRARQPRDRVAETSAR